MSPPIAPLPNIAHLVISIYHRNGRSLHTPRILSELRRNGLLRVHLCRGGPENEPLPPTKYDQQLDCPTTERDPAEFEPPTNCVHEHVAAGVLACVGSAGVRFGRC